MRAFEAFVGRWTTHPPGHVCATLTQEL
jgi:hypothetical protein